MTAKAPAPQSHILTIHYGSSSIKLSAFEVGLAHSGRHASPKGK